MKVADRSAIAPFIAMDVMRAANQRAADGHDVLHLEVGQPSTCAPAAVVEAARQALDRDRLGYTDALGIEALRRRIAQHYGEIYGVDIDWRRIAITTGSSGAFILGFLAAFDAGDRVALTEPGYPAYRNILKALGTTVVPLPVAGDTGFQPTVALLENTMAGEGDVEEPLAGFIVASPANPTGSMLSRDALAALCRWSVERQVRFVSDEIYHGITFGQPAETALAFTDQAIVINSFSKYYAMTGWRLGWMVLPEDLVRPAERLAQNLFISPPTLAQWAAITAFDCRHELDANVARYARNRELLLEALPRLGLGEIAPADGAFYLYADVSPLSNDSAELCARLLTETGVAITPGLDFDPVRGHRFVRISFAGSTEDMTAALARLAAWRS